MKVSVIVPVYNVEKYIEKCLKSIIEQSLNDFECLIIDDGSKDNSINLAKKVVNNDKRFVFYTKENGGLSDARNFGLNKAKGEYVCFIDSDDYVAKDLLLLTYNKAKEYNSDIVCFDLYYVYNNLNFKISKGADFENVSSYKDNKRIIFNNNSANNKLYKRDFLKNKQFIKDMWYEDMAVIPVWIAEANNMSYVNKPLYYYVQREGSISHSANPKLFDIYKAIDLLKKELNLDSSEASDFYVHNCLIMTTLRIKEINNKNERIKYYRRNIELLDKNYPGWYLDIKKEKYSLKYKTVFFLLKNKLFLILDSMYKL